MNGLCLASICDFLWGSYELYKGRSALQINIQAVLIFATGLKITEGGTQSE